MKKLMFAAAVAASSMAFAATPAAQVYDVTFSIKTTKAAAAKVNDKTNPVATEESYGTDGKLYYRTQTTLSWKGLIWGCNCEGINGVWEKVTPCSLVYDKETKEYVEVEGEANSVKGCIVWDTKGKTPVYMGEDVNVTLSKIDVTSNPGWGWNMLQLIEKNGAGAESVWTIAGYKDLCDEDDLTFQFAGAGFGTVQFVKSGDDVACNSYVKKLSGNFAGVMRAPVISMVTQKEVGCSFCGGQSEITDCEYIAPWAWCDFGSLCGCELGIALVEDYTAAYGTWTIAYNSSASKKLSDKTTILDAYNFKSLPEVAAAIEIAEDQIMWEPADECEGLKDAWDKAIRTRQAASQANVLAIAAIKDAEDNVASLTTSNLQAEVEAARLARGDAGQIAYDSLTNWNKKVELEADAVVALNAAQLAYTNTSIVVTLKTSNHGSETTLTVKGYDKLMAQVPAVGSSWAFIAVTTNGTAAIADGTVFNADSYAKVQKLVDDAKAIVDNAEAAVTAAKTATAEAKSANETAEAAYKVAKDAVKVAEDKYDDRAALQAAADRKLSKAEAAQLITAANLADAQEAEAAAEKAYKNADCE